MLNQNPANVDLALNGIVSWRAKLSDNVVLREGANERPGGLGVFNPKLPESPRRKFLLRLASDELLERFGLNNFPLSRRSWNNYYSFFDPPDPSQATIYTNRVELRPIGSNKYILRYHSTAAPSAKVILNDVQKRVRALLQSRAGPSSSEAPPAIRKESFAKAMYAFFSAMPFQRGNASIGRAYFSAVGRVAFGSEFKGLSGDIDIYALMRDERRFVDFVFTNSF